MKKLLVWVGVILVLLLSISAVTVYRIRDIKGDITGAPTLRQELNNRYLKTVADTTFVKIGDGFQLHDSIYFKDETYTKQQVQALPTQPPFEQALLSLGTTMKALPVSVGAMGLFSGTAPMVSGAVYFIYFNITDTISSTGVRWIQRNIFVGTGDAYNGFGLYSVSAGTYTFITQTVTNNDLWKVADFATGTKAWPTPQTLLPGKYMVAILWHASSTSAAPNIYTHGAISANHAVFLTNSNKVSSYINGQTALPNPTTTGAATTTGTVLWGIWLY